MPSKALRERRGDWRSLARERLIRVSRRGIGPAVLALTLGACGTGGQGVADVDGVDSQLQLSTQATVDGVVTVVPAVAEAQQSALLLPAPSADGEASANPSTEDTAVTVTPTTPLATTPTTTPTIAPSTAPTSTVPTTTTAPTTTPPSVPPTDTVASSTTTSTTPVTPTTPISPSTTADQGSNIVVFRVAAGTGSGPWNSFDDPVRVTVGQTLRIYNDDSVKHTLHAGGAPFGHGKSIAPGSYRDHVIAAPSDPSPGSPRVYEHSAGKSAPFWIVATNP